MRNVGAVLMFVAMRVRRPKIRCRVWKGLKAPCPAVLLWAGISSALV